MMHVPSSAPRRRSMRPFGGGSLWLEALDEREEPAKWAMCSHHFPRCHSASWHGSEGEDLLCGPS